MSNAKLARRPSASRALEFGDYAEVPEECPATTTCPIVCVSDVNECPTNCDEGMQLCANGNCEATCDADLESSCLCESTPVVCPKVVDLYDDCFVNFGSYYNADKACQEAQEEAIPQLSFWGPWFVGCYIWIISVTFSVFIWCYWNQKLARGTGELSLEAAASKVKSEVPPKAAFSKDKSRSDDHNRWTQTGYQAHLLGTILYWWVMCTLFAFQVLLLTWTILYYVQQGAITRWTPVFYDDVQALKAFEVTWMVGIVWNFAFFWAGSSGTSIRSLFYRRCALSQATHVAVVAPKQSLIHTEQRQKKDSHDGGKMFAVNVLASCWRPVLWCLCFFFSYPYTSSGERYEVVYCTVETDPRSAVFFFNHRMRRYIYDAETEKFVPGTFFVGRTFGDLLDQCDGLTTEEVLRRRGLVGHNCIPMKRPTLWINVTQEFSKAFYLYQNFMVWTWAPFWYYHMAIVQTIVRVSSGLIVAVFQYMNDSVLYKISCVEGLTEVLRDGTASTIPMTELVPGDVVLISPGTVYCDMVILRSEHLLVDESAITGESTPIVKSRLDPAMKADTIPYNPNLHKAHTICAGSIVLETAGRRNNNSSPNELETNTANKTTLGLVLSTGSFTTKGELLTEVLSIKRQEVELNEEAKVVIFILLVQACFYIAMVFYFLKDQWEYAWFFGTYVLGTLIPPLLPTVFVVSVGISAKRLQQKKITCTYPEGILMAGKVNLAFFDKTGTLTKQGMNFVGCVGSGRGYGDMGSIVRLGMAVCHDIKVTLGGELVGNQVDKASFNATAAVLYYSSTEQTKVVYCGKTYTVLKNFAFENHRATQSVIVEGEDKTRMVFVKGSPEAVKALCIPESVPENFETILRSGAKSGLYQLVIGFKDFDHDAMTGDDHMTQINRVGVEKELTFAGFINFQNVMKEDSPRVISSLADGRVDCTMITGDSVLTGICIARETGLIEEGKRVFIGQINEKGKGLQWVDADTFAIVDRPSDTLIDSLSKVDLAVTGKAWQALLVDDPKYVSAIVKYIRVFGRCTPSDKVSVVTVFAEKGFKTLMCGDGQNDCGALKAAHVGIALSSNEASVVAPFTSLDKSISSVIEVLKEGRCALASVFAAYSYYIMYGQIEAYLQVISAYLHINFAEWCWVFLDGFWSITMAFSLPLAKAAKKLSPYRPTASLFSFHTITSVCGLLFWNFFFICVALFALNAQDWYQCRKWENVDVSTVLTIGDNYEASVLFIIGGYQYIATAIPLNFGYSFREHWIKNYIFVFFSSLWTVFLFVATMHPSSFSCIWRLNCDNEDVVRSVTTKELMAISNPFNTTVFPLRFRWILVVIMVVNMLTLIIWEYYFVNGCLRWCVPYNRTVDKSQKMHFFKSSFLDIRF